MGAGKAYKFQGSTFRVLTAFDSDSPPPAITGITKANPAVVSDTAHGRADGDVVKLSGIVGMTELNDVVAIINVIDANSFELDGIDSTGYTTYVSGGTYDVGQFSQFCELTNYNRQGGSSPEIDTTNACSTAQEFVLGLPDFGTTQMDYNFAPRTGVQEAIEDFYRSGALMAVKITMPSNAGEMVQLGYVQQTSESAGVGGKWDGSMTIRNTGTRYDVPA